MRRLMLVVAALTLTGCVVGNMDSSDYTYVPYIQTFQKAGQQGHTDPVQRKVDLQSCGVNKATVDNPNWSAGSALPEETAQQIIARSKKLNSCMQRKGYIVYGYFECGPVKENKGLCN